MLKKKKKSESGVHGKNRCYLLPSLPHACPARECAPHAPRDALMTAQIGFSIGIASEDLIAVKLPSSWNDIAIIFVNCLAFFICLAEVLQ